MDKAKRLKDKVCQDDTLICPTFVYFQYMSTNDSSNAL